jgi:aminoglycoside phosphotransferase (APT) family kinase protein
VPRKFDYDPESSTLVLEFLAGHRPLGVRRGSGPGLEAELVAELGGVLSGLHSLSPPVGDSRPQWILSLVHPPVGILREATRAQLELVGRVQRSSTWREALGSLAEGWRPRSFVHGDLRFSNLLIGDRRGPGGAPTLKLIDWELAGPGDPGWDAGWVVAEILVSRLRDLGEAFPLLRAFWAAYVEGPREAATHATLDSAIRWAAAASLQMAYEGVGPSHEEGISTRKLLEVGRSLLERPGVWIERVFWGADR